MKKYNLKTYEVRKRGESTFTKYKGRSKESTVKRLFGRSKNIRLYSTDSNLYIVEWLEDYNSFLILGEIEEE